MKKIMPVLVAVLTPILGVAPAAPVEKDAPTTEKKMEKKLPTLTYYYLDG